MELRLSYQIEDRDSVRMVTKGRNGGHGDARPTFYRDARSRFCPLYVLAGRGRPTQKILCLWLEEAPKVSSFTVSPIGAILWGRITHNDTVGASIFTALSRSVTGAWCPAYPINAGLRTRLKKFANTIHNRGDGIQ